MPFLVCRKQKTKNQRDGNCRCLFSCVATKKQKKEGDGNVVIIAFFGAPQAKNKKKKTTSTLLASFSLVCRKQKTKEKA
jgi:hypothetical protein